jgi:lipoyl(octanoyl) transferase
MKPCLHETDRFVFIDWGRRGYADAIQEMNALVEDRIAERGKDTIVFVEHDPVITLGRMAKSGHIIGPLDETGSSVSGIPVVSCDRGGDVTLHSPGQLVIYPIIALKVREQRLHDLLTAYEEWMIRTAETFGVRSFRIKGKTGVWTETGKLASIGIHLKRWVTYHGIALNVSNDLKLFDNIVPCGLHGIKMTSLALETGHRIDIKEVKTCALRIFHGLWDDFSENRKGVKPCMGK